MAQPYLGEIKLFAGNFAPLGWADCSGQVIPIAQVDALFQLIGTTFGGNGTTTFALPDLRGRTIVGQGQGPGLPTNRIVGDPYGSETVVLTVPQIPAHTHQLLAYDTPATSSDPAGLALARPGLANPPAPQVGNSLFYLDANVGTPNVAALPADMLQIAGGSQPHENMAPFLTLRYIIALFGTYPTQS